MSLSDKIIEIIKKQPMSGISDVHSELKRQGISRSVRTIQRHFDKLLDDRLITLAGYNRKKHKPLYRVWDKGAKYESIMDCPEINDVDWSKVPKNFAPTLAWYWKRGEEIPWFRDMIRLELKTYTGTRENQTIESWSKNVLGKIKTALKNDKE